MKTKKPMICPNPKCPAVELSGGVLVCPKCGTKLVPAGGRFSEVNK